MTDLGAESVAVLRGAGLPEDLFSGGPVWLTQREHFDLWRGIEAEVGGSNVPRLIDRAVSADAFLPPMFAALHSTDLTVAARRIAEYEKLVGPMRLQVVQSEAATKLRFVWPGDTDPPASLVGAECVFWVALVRNATGIRVCPIGVTLALPAAIADAYSDYFGIGASPGTEFALTFSAEDSNRPFRAPDESMLEFFDPELRSRLPALDEDAQLSVRVRAALLDLIPAGSASMESVAQELDLSTRTLQRRLSGFGTTFQRILKDTREALARHYLYASSLSAAEIAFLLGYDDANSFYRAFRAWTGSTPERVRSRARSRTRSRTPSRAHSLT